MRKLHYSIAPIIALMSIWSALLGAPNEFYLKHLPPGVSMGMSPAEFVTVRPSARKNDFRSVGKDSEGTLEMVEFRRGRDIASASAYRFRAGKLSAVIETTKTSGLPIEHIQAAAGNLAKELKEEFVLQREDQFVRSAGTVAAVLTAQLWED